MVELTGVDETANQRTFQVNESTKTLDVIVKILFVRFCHLTTNEIDS